MNVCLTLIGPLKLPPAGRIIETRVRKGTRLRTVLRRTLGYTERELEYLQIISMGHPVHLDELITEDMDLQITLRLGGG